jgi:hypothetical protein
MARPLMTRLYGCLLKLYPRPFLAEFGDEMRAVFAQALNGVGVAGFPPVKRRIEMIRLFLKEVWDLPVALLPALRFHAGSGRRDAFANAAGDREQDKPDAWVGTRASWGEALLGALPFLLFGLAHFLIAIHELGKLTNLTVNPWLYYGSGLLLLIAIGLAIGGIKGYPRWSYAYLGMTVYLSSYYSNGSFSGVVYGWRFWVPLIVTILLPLLLTRSLRPLARLIQGAWNDWTRLSFGLYAYLLPIYTILFFEVKWGTDELSGLAIDTLLLAAGTVAFLRSRTIWGRVVSLQAVMFILACKGFLFAEWLRGPQGFSLDMLDVLIVLLFFGGFMFLPGLVGLLQRGVSALSTR